MDESYMRTRPVFPLILSMALPMVLSMLVNALYNIVDSFFVAKISENAMTALSLVFPVQNFINAAAIGFGVGLNAVISLQSGAGNSRNANIAATHGLLLSAVHGLLFTAVTIPLMPGFLRLFTTDAEVLAFGTQYSAIVFSFALAVTLGLAFEKIFQAVGRMKTTMISLSCGCIANIILDPVLIFGPGFLPALGIKGAAIATGLGQVITLGVYLAFYRAAPPSVRVGRQYLVPSPSIDRKLYAVGVPAALNQALPSVLVSCLNGLLAPFSQSYVVILGIYYKLQTFLYLPANGIIQGMRPIIGYNFGAGEHQRVRQIYHVTLRMSGIIMALGTVICLAASQHLMGLFTDNPETIRAGQTALRVISGGFLVSSVSVTASGALEGLGMGTQSFFISLFRYVVILLPAAWILCRIFGAGAVWNAFWITEAATAAIAMMISWKFVLGTPKKEDPFF